MEESDVSAWQFIEPYWPDSPWLRVCILLGIAIVSAGGANLFLKVVIARLTARTETELDDKMIEYSSGPLMFTILCLGILGSVVTLHFPPTITWAAQGVVLTSVVLTWSYAGGRIVDELVGAVARQAEKDHTHGVINPRTVPLFTMGFKAALYGASGYFFFLAWDLDLTGWLASAGVLGIAVGFAAKDTLGNIFAGVSIIADAHYKLGDIIMLETGERGRVVEIGLRATRLITKDDIEIIVPNAMMADSKIRNESAGPALATRVVATVEVSYESDVDHVRQVLFDLAQDLPHAADYPRPNVHFDSFGASGLVFQLQVWVADPEFRPALHNAMNMAIYKTFAKEGIEIPYSKHDVYLWNKTE